MAKWKFKVGDEVQFVTNAGGQGLRGKIGVVTRRNPYQLYKYNVDIKGWEHPCNANEIELVVRNEDLWV